MMENQLILINQSEDEPAYYLRAWRKINTLDRAIARDNMHWYTTRTVNNQLGRSDHTPVTLTITSAARQHG